jgi:hypothetical protein
MSSFRLYNRICKVGALIAVTLILPTLAYAGYDSGNGNDHKNNGKQNGRGDTSIVPAPEANAGWVLVPFFGAVLLFSSRLFFRVKADQKNGC